MIDLFMFLLSVIGWWTLASMVFLLLYVMVVTARELPRMVKEPGATQPRRRYTLDDLLLEDSHRE